MFLIYLNIFYILTTKCPIKRQFNLSLIGAVKGFQSLTNFRDICNNEGFQDINFDIWEENGSLWSSNLTRPGSFAK